ALLIMKICAHYQIKKINYKISLFYRQNCKSIFRTGNAGSVRIEIIPELVRNDCGKYSQGF
ncbi:MAG: hypothetical protein KAQ79_09085, partial [Cyclobacteriaceae bacterium]|nr:hypothetical protein [Cyclobacteriaceae bacterium]